MPITFAREPMALLIGFALDQQVPVQWAFSAPSVLKERLGTIDPRALGGDGRRRARGGKPRTAGDPPLSSAMARRIGEPASYITSTYDGDAARIWTGASDAADLKRRIGRLPGFGDMKVASMYAVLVKLLGQRPTGWEAELPQHPTLMTRTRPRRLPTIRPRSEPTRPLCARPRRSSPPDSTRPQWSWSCPSWSCPSWSCLRGRARGRASTA